VPRPTKITETKYRISGFSRGTLEISRGIPVCRGTQFAIH